MSTSTRKLTFTHTAVPVIGKLVIIKDRETGTVRQALCRRWVAPGFTVRIHVERAHLRSTGSPLRLRQSLEQRYRLAVSVFHVALRRVAVAVDLISNVAHEVNSLRARACNSEK